MIAINIHRPRIWWRKFLPMLPRSAGVLRARVSLGCIWQFRRRVFRAVVTCAITDDMMPAIRSLEAALIAPFIIVFSIPYRLGVWAIRPFLTPLTQKDPQFWADFAEATNRANRAENALQRLKDSHRWTT